MKSRSFVIAAIFLLALALVVKHPGQQASRTEKLTLILNVRIFDGKRAELSGPQNVLIRGNKIEQISSRPIPIQLSLENTVIDGGGRTLMPGLIDAHIHLATTMLSSTERLAPDLTLEAAEALAARGAGEMLLRGFTSVRDVGGPTFKLKALIDRGEFPGPRVWASGPGISQTSGHGDMRGPNEPSRRFSGIVSRVQQLGGIWIADGRAEVLTAVRENLRSGASHIKVMAGGGISSDSDPLDVSQYTLDELKAAVEAADDWNTYVTVHAYSPRAVRRAIEAGVKCIEHGHSIDEETAKLMAEKGIWWSLQPFTLEGPDAERYPEGSINREKQKEMYANTAPAYALAKKFKVKTAFGTDRVFDSRFPNEQNADLVKLARWYTPAEALIMATAGNAELLALSGPRSPYQEKLGVVEEGALADLLIIDGDPLANFNLIGDPGKNFVVIVKDGVIYKNSLNAAR